MKKKLEKITEETLLLDLINDEEALKILNSYGVPCIACPLASVEISDLSVGFILKMYNLDAQGLISDLNKYYQKNEKKA